MLVKFTAEVMLADAKDFGRISSMNIACFERPVNVFALQLLQSRERRT